MPGFPTKLTPEQKIKFSKGKCVTYNCRGQAKYGYYCNSCKHQRRLAISPEKVAYENLKGRAKQRNVYFALSIEYWAQWCKDNDYIRLKGRFKNCISVDRKEPELGYVDGNLQPLTVSENSKKKYTDYYRKQQGEVPDDYTPEEEFSEHHDLKSSQQIEEEIAPF